jgi:hypothetical protein
MSEANQHSSTASFYASPAEALKAPPEESAMAFFPRRFGH